MIVITTLAYLSAFYYLSVPKSNLAKWIFIGFLGSMILNSIFPHVIATIALKKYAPGLVTGIMLNIPINSLIILRLFENHQLAWKELIFSTMTVGITLLVLIPLLFKIGRKITTL
ncbi:HXXEE domain-containing protein [Peribacillus butanolivorans]|uniref:HXXEE domain-containing protein n=1 Tax=Peribacillus butanolivorans TaxID=421767 RepID=UPI0036DF771C